MFSPNFRKSIAKLSETTPSDMRELMRQVAGKSSVGEREPQLMARATRRLNRLLSGENKITPRRARGYWNAEYETVKPEHAAAALDLVSVLPVEEAIDEIEKQIDAHRECLTALLQSRDGLVRSYSGTIGAFSPSHPLRRAEDLARNETRNPASNQDGLTSSLDDRFVVGT